MAITIDWATSIIYVPKADLTDLGNNIYEHDVNAFRLELKNIEASVDGGPFSDTHRHNTEVTLAGVTYARTFEVLPPYTVEYEDGQYIVSCAGANHNIADVKVPNQVSIIVGNSAGLIVREGTEAGLTDEEHDHLMDLPDAHDIWSYERS